MSRTFRIDGTFDIECASWTRLVCAALYRPASGVTIVRTLGDLVDGLLARGGWWWSWYGGRYDMLAVVAELHRRGYSMQCHTSGGGMSRVVCGGLTLVDAWYLCPMPLGDTDTKQGAVRIVGRAAAELGWPCICAGPGQRPCGGYCQITTNLPPEKQRQLEAYCGQDARDVYDVLVALWRAGQEEGLQMRGTLGGTAWESARALLGLPVAEHRSSTYARLKSASYGGRGAVGRARAQHGDHYDINGCYPGALATTPVPVGDPVELGRSRAGAAYRNDREGVYRATVHVPDDLYHPPLPWRHAGRVGYPTGRMTGTWCRPELAAAEARGVRVEAVHGAIVYPDGARVLFDELVARWYGRRAAAGRTSALGEWWRLLANSLVGKFGEGPLREMVVIRPDRVEYCDGRSRRSRAAGCSVHHCTRRCGAFRQLDDLGLIWAKAYWRPSTSAHLPWAIYTLSAARVQWLEGAEAVGDDFVYGDTDSILAQRPERDLAGEQFVLGDAGVRAPGPVGERVGQWSHKGRFYDWWCLGLKNYRYDTDERTVIRAAGVPHASLREWQALDGTGEALMSGRGVMSLREAAALGRRVERGDDAVPDLFVRRFQPVRPREIDGWYGCRLLHENGRTYPVDRGEVEKRFHAQRLRGRRFDVGGAVAEEDRRATAV